ncbi:hypothetical protein DBR17_02780 [Sphingomonas sp. HMWF008]|nr:hypothetical protein DBR17_02780 [Sphingomonas sp. HMWF008]
MLHEAARDTGFLAAFTNLRTGDPCPNENALLATIPADATNLGLATGLQPLGSHATFVPLRTSSCRCRTEAAPPNREITARFSGDVNPLRLVPSRPSAVDRRAGASVVATPAAPQAHLLRETPARCPFD